MRKLTVLAYLRYSCHAQDYDYSNEKQQSSVEAYSEKHDMTIERYYSDRARSGKYSNRRGLQELKYDIKNGTVRSTTLLVNKVDRLNRNADNMDADLNWFAEHGIRIIGINDGSDTATAAGMKNLKENAAKAEKFSEAMKQSMRKKQLETARDCKHLGGTPPLGYLVDRDGHYIVDKKTAPVIRSIYLMYRLGMGYPQIIQELNHNGCRTANGQAFTVSSIRTILANPKYTGTYTYDRTAPKNPDGTRNSHAVKDQCISIDDGIPHCRTASLPWNT